MLLLRLSGRKVCECVKTKGFLWKGKHFFVRYLSGAPRNQTVASPTVSALYVGTLTSAKLDKSAVRRNRMRRRCREALRLSLKQIRSSKSLVTCQQVTGHCLLTSDLRPADQRPATSFQLLLLPRSSSLSADFGELLSDAEHFLASLPSRAR